MALASLIEDLEVQRQGNLTSRAYEISLRLELTGTALGPEKWQ